MTLEERQEAVRDVTATLMDWFPNRPGLECERIAMLAVAACDRAMAPPQPYWWDGSPTRPPTVAEVQQFDGGEGG